MSYIKAYEYESSVNPNLKNIPIISKNSSDYDYGLNVIDLSENYNMTFPCTSPNLLASFIKIQKNNNLFINNNNYILNTTSHFFYVISGQGNIIDDKKEYHVKNGDILILPFLILKRIYIKNNHDCDLIIYYVNDSPLINFLGCEPKIKTFQPAIFSNEFIQENLKKLSNPNNNRKGILLGNQDTEKIGTKTITPILWSLYNELPPKTNQRVHRHNSVALDLCVICDDPCNVYTLVGNELDENGNIINPTKINWKSGEMFITPPTLWHSHHNLGDTYAYILPIQDAGLLLYQRILGIDLK